MKKTNNHFEKNLMILTGGKSRRMGSDKSTLPFGRYSVIEYMVRRFAGDFDHIYVSVADKEQIEHFGRTQCVILGQKHTEHLDRFGENCPDEERLWEKVRLVPDIYPDCGPMGGLYSVLSVIDQGGICVIAVDTPFVESKHLLSLIPVNNEKTDYCVAKTNGRIQPLCAWYGRQILPVLEALLTSGNQRMMQIFEKCRGRMVELEDLPVAGGPVTEFFNMNDKEGYYLALETVRHIENRIPLISFAAWSGTGKTAFIEKLIPELTEKGIKVAVIKHDGHDFDIDVEGKDTYRFKKSGAVEVVISSKSKTARICSESGDRTLESLAFSIKSVDVIIVEGYKFGPQPKIEMHRSDISNCLMDISNRVAVISDVPWNIGVPVFQPDDISGVCEFIVTFINKKVK